MSCCGQGGLTEYQPEYQKRQKPENHAGCPCACGGSTNTCDTPSKALPGSALYEWEQIHGKILETVTFEQGPDGRTVQIVKKEICARESSTTSKNCCSLRYKVTR